MKFYCMHRSAPGCCPLDTGPVLFPRVALRKNLIAEPQTAQRK